MAIKSVVFLVIAWLLASCDSSYRPPLIRNDCDTNIELAATFVDGTTNQLSIPPCMMLLLGNMSKSGAEFQQLLVKKDGEVIYTLGSKQIWSLIEQEKEHKGFSLWSIGMQGIHFKTGTVAGVCPYKDKN